MRKYPKFHENPVVPLADLLEWELWPAYITIYGMDLAACCLSTYHTLIYMYNNYLIHTLAHI